MIAEEIIKLGPFEFANDFQYLPYYLWVFGIGFIILICSIMAHEIGHWLAFKLVAKKTVSFNRKGLKFTVGKQEDYVGLTEKQYMLIVQGGLLGGLVPIMITGFFFFPFFLMVIPYFWGCRKDLKHFTERIQLEED